MKIKKTILIIFVLGILLLGSLGYIGFEKYALWKQQKDLSVFQQGAQYGYEQAIIQIAQRAVRCEEVPLIIENQTINVLAVDCLSQD